MARTRSSYSNTRAAAADRDDMAVDYDLANVSNPSTNGFLHAQMPDVDQRALEHDGYTDCSLTPSPPPQPVVPPPTVWWPPRAGVKRARSEGEGSDDDWSLAGRRRRVRMESPSGSPAADTTSAMSSTAATRNNETYHTTAASAAVDTYDDNDESDQDGDWSLVGRSKLRRAPTPGPRGSVLIKKEPVDAVLRDDSPEADTHPERQSPRNIRPLPRRARSEHPSVACEPRPAVTPPRRIPWRDRSPREPTIECADSPETEARAAREMREAHLRRRAKQREEDARWRIEQGLPPVTAPERVSEEAVSPTPPPHQLLLRSPTPYWRPTVPAAPRVSPAPSEEAGSEPPREPLQYPYGGRYRGRYPRDLNHPLGHSYSLEAVMPASPSPTPPPPPPPVQIIRTVTHAFELGGVKREEEDIKLSFDDDEEQRAGDQAASTETPVAGPSRRRGAGAGRGGRGGRRGRGRRGGR